MPSLDPNKLWALFVSDPITFLLCFGGVALASGAFVWWITRQRIATLEERLRLAADKQTVVNAQVEKLTAEAGKLSVAALAGPTGSAGLQFDTTKLTGTVGDLALATAAVSQTLTIVGPVGRVIFEPIGAKTRKSDD
jgi:hypothetical protein